MHCAASGFRPACITTQQVLTRPMAAPKAQTATPLAGPRGVAAARLPQGALYEQVAEQLRSRIMAHSLAPGSWIDEQLLTAEFGISRTPLREALKVLASEGLVTMKLRRGAYVTEVSERDLAEVYHLLALLESDAAVVVAGNATEAQLAELDALHQKLETLWVVAYRDWRRPGNERLQSVERIGFVRLFVGPQPPDAGKTHRDARAMP